MIALIASAFAGTDVYLMRPMVRTAPVRFLQQLDDGFGSETTERLTPDRIPLYGGLGVDTHMRRKKDGDIILSTSVLTWKATWTEHPGDFTASSTEIRTAVGWLSKIEEDAFADVYGTAVGGMTTTIFDPTMFPTHITFAPYGHAGVGLGHDGRVPMRAEIRAAFTIRGDRYTGLSQLPDDVFRWEFFPGSASLNLVMGLGW